MALGPGKYDEQATAVREATRAESVIVVVINGSRGSGFSVQTTEPLALKLPAILRIIADQIDV